MRAITVSEYGGPPAVTELPKPEPGPGELLIKVQAAGMNPMDRKIANGAWRERMPGTFPMVLGADVAGVVEDIGDGATRFAVGDEVFGQLLIAPLGSAGTYAEDVAAPEDAPLAPTPDGMDPAVAASLPTAGGTALGIIESFHFRQRLEGKTVLIVGAGGGVGSFLTQLAANGGAYVIANVHDHAADRMRGYGVAEIIDHGTVSVPDAVRAKHPDGIDVLIDLASERDSFAELASLVRPGGVALTTTYVADPEALAQREVTGINYRYHATPELLERLARAVAAGRIVPPPITDLPLDEVPAALARNGHVDGKTVITV
jgi:NADPH2:quinone reductase